MYHFYPTFKHLHLCLPSTSQNISLPPVFSWHYPLIALRPRGLCNSSAILATLNIFDWHRHWLTPWQCASVTAIDVHRRVVSPMSIVLLAWNIPEEWQLLFAVEAGIKWVNRWNLGRVANPRPVAKIKTVGVAQPITDAANICLFIVGCYGNWGSLVFSVFTSCVLLIVFSLPCKCRHFCDSITLSKAC